MRSRTTAVFLMMLFGAVLLMSCKRNPYKVNVSSILVNIGIKRLEKDLFSIDPDSIPSDIPALKVKYGQFLQLFSYVINAGDIKDQAFSDLLLKFCTDKLNFEVYQSVVKAFPDEEELGKDLDNSFRHYLYYFPGSKIPAVFTCITGFNNSIITGDSVLGISLDRYLGRDCDYYKRLQIYKYVAARMNSRNIVPDCMYAWGSTEWNMADMKYQADNVVTEMVHYGKLKYFEKCMLPLVNDTIIFGFSASQMRFCKNNEDQMWLYLVEHNLLFSTDRFVIRKLTDEAPFTAYFTSESPGRAGIWIGFRIVESYMMRNRNVSLHDLMENRDIQGIIEKAKYNPQ